MNIQMDASIDSDATMQWNMQHLWRLAGGQTGRHVAVCPQIQHTTLDACIAFV